MHRALLVILVALASPFVCGAETDRAAATARLSEELGALIKGGEKPKAWVDVFGKKSDVAISAADAKALTVLVQGNPLSIAWDKISNDDLLSIAKAMAGENGARLLSAAEIALALRFDAQAGDLLAKAQTADPSLAPKIAALAAKIPSAPAAVVKPADTTTPAASSDNPPDAKPAVSNRLPMGWWKGYQAPAVAAAKVYSGRPRIFLRDKAWGEGGLTLDALRTRATLDPWKGFIPRFTSDVSNLAMKYMLSGDKAAADAAVAKLLQKISYSADTSDGDDVEELCMAYDWLHAYPGFGAEQKKKAADSIAAAADEFIKRLNTGGPHIFHTRMYAWANGIVFAGIALAGDHPRAAEFLTYGYKYWREKLFPARWHLDGVWPNGFGYGRKYLARSTFAFLNAWKSGTGEDLWALIQREQNDWARAMVMFLIYTQRPDGQYPHYGDCFNSDDEKFSGGLAMLASCGTRDPFAAGLVDALHQKHALRVVEGHWNIYPLLFWDPALPRRQADELPFARMFGADAAGCAVMRGGWGAKDAHVFFKCGDFFESHGHFDQGSFEIFREKPLAVDSGAYAGPLGGNHRMKYARQSIASNTLSIVDTAEKDDPGWQRNCTWQGADTMETYLAHTAAEMGSIAAFRAATDHTVIVADMSAAYESTKAKSVTRSVVFLRGTHLIVCDVVQCAKPGIAVRFLLHYPTDASIDKTRTIIDNGPSRLSCDTLWPANAKIAKLPGFTVNDRDYAPEAAVPSKEEAGAGRIEVETTEPLAILVHVLTIGAKDASAERGKAKVEGGEVKVEIAGRKITFSNGGKTVSVK